MALISEDPRNTGLGIGRGLASLAQQKLEKIQQNMVIHEGTRQIKGLFPGISDPEASALSYLKATDPKSFQGAIKAIFLGGGFGGEEGVPEQQGPAQAASNQLQQPAQEQQSPLQSLNIPQKSSALGFANQLNEGSLKGIFGNDPNLNNLLSSISGNNQAQQQVLNPQQPQQQPNQPGTGPVEPGNQSGILQPEQPKKRKTLAEVIQKGSQNPDLEIKREALDEKKTRDRFAASKDFLNQVAKENKLARESLESLEDLEAIEATGKIDTPQYISFLKRIGINEDFLKNPETGLAQKVINSFIRGAKDYFGARVTNFELEAFLATIPSLTQTPEGRDLVIKSLKKYYQGQRLYFDEVNKILKENKGIPPYDIRVQVEERIGSHLDKAGKEFRDYLKQTSEFKGNAISFDKIPSATAYPNAELKDPKGGYMHSVKSDGSWKWVKGRRPKSGKANIEFKPEEGEEENG